MNEADDVGDRLTRDPDDLLFDPRTRTSLARFTRRDDTGALETAAALRTAARTPAPHDRRSVLVRITPSGLTWLDEFRRGRTRRGRPTRRRVHLSEPADQLRRCHCHTLAPDHGGGRSSWARFRLTEPRNEPSSACPTYRPSAARRHLSPSWTARSPPLKTGQPKMSARTARWTSVRVFTKIAASISAARHVSAISWTLPCVSNVRREKG